MPFKEMKAFPGSPQLPCPDVGVTKQQPYAHMHMVSTQTAAAWCSVVSLETSMGTVSHVRK